MGGNYAKGVYDQLMDVMARLDAMEAAHVQDQREIKMLTSEVESLRKENACLREEVSGLRQENAALREEGAALRKENSLLRDDNERMKRILDNDRTEAGTYSGTYTGTATITIDMHRTEQVTALKYLGDALGQITVEVSQDGTSWTEAKKGYTGLNGTEEQTIWLDCITEAGDRKTDFIGTYDARYVRLTIAPAGAGDGQEGSTQASVSIKEIEICGPSGDNLEFMSTADGTPAIGVLSADYKYGKQDADVIPEGSLVFTGTYKGNPAYNVVILYDTEGNVIGAKEGDPIYDEDGNVIGKEEGEVHAAQVIFAEVPDHGELGETSNGTWVYYVEPGHWDANTLSKIQGVRGELYRVDNALTLEGERIVSDTQVIEIPKVLPEITLEGKIPD